MITVEIIIREHPAGAGMQLRCYGNEQSTAKEQRVADMIRATIQEDLPPKLAQLPEVTNVIAMIRNGAP